MTEKTGRNHGGKRLGAGRKRMEPWLSHWWTGFRTGNPRMMAEADQMRAAAAAAEVVQPSDKSVKFAGDLCPPVAASCGAEDLTAPLALPDPEVIERRRRAAAERQKRARTREALGLVVLPIELHEAQIADALIEARLLTEDETADRGRVAEAVAEVVAKWAGGKLASRVTVAAGAGQVSSAYENCDPRPPHLVR